MSAKSFSNNVSNKTVSTYGSLHNDGISERERWWCGGKVFKSELKKGRK